MVGLVQALLEMQRQRETTRLGNTRELPRRASSTAAIGLPAPTAEEASAVANGHMRRQSLSFTGKIRFHPAALPGACCSILSFVISLSRFSVSGKA